MPQRDPDFGELADTADLFDTAPARPRSEVVADALEILGERRRPAGRREHARLQYRGHYPDVSDLREELGL